MARRLAQPEINTAEAFEGLRSDYNAARQTRFRRRLTGVNSAGSGSDYHYRRESDYLRMLELARAVDRNDPVVGQGISRLIANVLQDGIRLDPRTGNPELDAAISQRYQDWSEDPYQCDSTGQHSLHDLAALGMRATIVDGDIFFLPLLSGELQAIEAHRVRTPQGTKRNVIHGVLLDDQRRRLEIWITKDDIDPLTPVKRVRDMLRIPAHDALGDPNVFQLYLPKRITQTRGVSAMAPVVDQIGMHDDIQFARLVQQQLVSCFAIIREMAPDSTPFGGDKNQKGAQTTEVQADSSTRLIEGVAPGMEIFGKPGESIKGFTPNVPNAEFFEHAMMILTFISINLDLPVAVLLLDPSRTNFSGWRGAMDQARLGFRRLQRFMINRFYRPIYRWKLQQWIADDAEFRRMATRVGDEIFAHAWHPPTWKYIEPLKDASADLLRLRNGLVSPRALYAERGRDIEDVRREIIEDNTASVIAAKKAAAKINALKLDKQPVHWQQILSLPAPSGLTINVDAGATGDEPVSAAKRDEG